jgi:alpha-tubulin suppressor-like RCC1 family protein
MSVFRSPASPLRLPALIVFLFCLALSLGGCISSTTNAPVTDPTPDNNDTQSSSTTPTTPTTPTSSGPTTGLKQISSGANHNCAIKNVDGSLWCWGADSNGQLGNKSTNDLSSAVLTDNGAWTQVASGGSHSCAINNDGTLWCWGANASGQLGIGTTAANQEPAQVGSDTNWQSIATGVDHSCAIKTDGTLWCWGGNSKSQLGNGGTTDSTDPIQIGSNTDWTAISLGNKFSCATKINQSLWCWGDNSAGQLSYDKATPVFSTPQQESSMSSWNKVATGNGNTCAITNSQALYCWGDNSYGQLTLNNITTTDSSTPQQIYEDGPVAATTPFTAQDVAVGDGQSCAIKTDGTLWCWGNNSSGQLGVGTTSSLTTPHQVSHTTTWREVNAGDHHTCAIDADYVGYCWGLNDSGQLAAGNLLNTDSPRLFDTSENWQAIDSGELHSCGLKTVSGSSLYTLWCGGGNNYGQLGISSTANQSVPQQITGLDAAIPLPHWTAFSTGHYHTCAITDSGVLYCWGRNDDGQLGRGNNSDVATNWSPQTKVSKGADDWIKIVAGATHTCGIKATDDASTVQDTLYCWGDNRTGQLGDNTTTDSYSPIQVSEDPTIASPVSFAALDVAVGGYFNGTNTYGHTCAIKTDNTLWCWGENAQSQLGDNTTTSSNVPIQISADPVWVSVKAGNKYTCAQKSNKNIYCWGDNSAGQTGAGATPSPTSTVTAPTILDEPSTTKTTWLDYDLGQQSACAITTGNQLRCWGDNNLMQLTSRLTNTAKNSGFFQTPQLADFQNDWQAVAMGKTHGCGIREDSTTGIRQVHCWGDNSEFQFGDGNAWMTTPQKVPLE